MGLDLSQGNFHSSYSYFHHMRTVLAESIGITLSKMEGFEDCQSGIEGTISWSTVIHPIKYLLNHSDCDGHITWRRCGKIIAGLEVLIETEDYPEKFVESLNLLIESLQEAYDSKTNLLFL